MTSAILDASVLLALLHKEEGAAVAVSYLAGAVMSAVNVAEAAGKLIDAGLPVEMASNVIGSLGLEIVDYTAEDAYETARLRRHRAGMSLSLGDRACLALGVNMEGPIITADRSWADLDIAADVHLIR